MVGRSTKKIRVLVVDDSFFMKKLLSELLMTSGDIEVVGTASDGSEALKQAKALKPDVITMDYNMPLVNGVEAVKQILADTETGSPGIIMVSAYTGKESETALAALRAGAVDFIQKPSGELSFDIDKVKDELLQKVTAASKATIIRFAEEGPVLEKKTPVIHGHVVDRIIVIGASTGGPPLLEDILKEIPKTFTAAILVVQHMPDFFTKKFAERLDTITPLPVRWAQDGDRIFGGMIFVAPALTELHIEEHGDEKIIRCKECPPSHAGIHPSIDWTMGEIAEHFGDKTIGVILTGMGVDGLTGMAAVKKVGGVTIAQDPDTATINSMPDAIIHAKLADEILRPEQIAQRLIAMTS